VLASRGGEEPPGWLLHPDLAGYTEDYLGIAHSLEETVTGRLKVGMFLAPFHALGESPTVSMQRDMELIEWMDELGYDACFVGEHHSGGWEPIACPEIFIAAAAERTRHIKLGTGVVSLPYHHPLLLADRIIQLDHMTRGRVIFGVGPGALPSDAYMLGIDPLKQRERMYESLGVIMRLFRGETVTQKSDWFEMNDARLQLRPYSDPHPDVVVAALISPSGMVLAGREGVGVVSMPSLVPSPPVDLAEWWGLTEKSAAENNQTVDRANWWVGSFVYVAETREQALADVRAGANRFYQDYFVDTLGAPPGEGDLLDEAIARKGAFVGTPEDIIEAIEDLQVRAGGFGGFLHGHHEWAPRDKILRSHELFAREVLPHLQGQLDPLRESNKWVQHRQSDIFGTQPDVMRRAYQDAKQEIPEVFADGGAPFGGNAG
jgi:limonene 1,2-monooxygenase